MPGGGVTAGDLHVVIVPPGRGTPVFDGVTVEPPPPGTDPDALYDLTLLEQGLLDCAGAAPTVKAVRERLRCGLKDALSLVQAWRHLRCAMTWTEVQVVSDLDRVADGLASVVDQLRVWRKHRLDGRYSHDDVRDLRGIAETLTDHARCVRAVADAVKRTES